MSALQTNASLEEKTLEYWKISRSARGFDKVITTTRAITTTSNLLSILNPGRPLWGLIAAMQTNIINHGTCGEKPKSKDRAQVLTLSR